MNRKCITSNFQDSRNDRDIWLPRQSSKIPLQHWGIHLKSTGLQCLAVFSVKQKIWRAVLPCISNIISHFLLCLVECLEDSFMKQELWRTIPSCFGKVQQSFSVTCLVCTAHCQQSRRNNFLPKWLALPQWKKTPMEFLQCPSFFYEVNWCCQGQLYLTVMKSSELTQHAIFCRSLTCLKIIYLSKIYLSMI